jgi:hypothetical protein
VSDVVVTRWIAASPRRCSHSSPTSNDGLHGRVWAVKSTPALGRPARDHAGRRRRIRTLHRGRATTADRLHLGVGGKLDSHPARILDRHDRARAGRQRHDGPADPLRVAAGRDARAASQRMGTLLGPARASRDWRRPRSRPLWQVALPRRHSAVKSRYPEFVHCLFVC